MKALQFFDNGEFRLRVAAHGDSFRVGAPGLSRALGFHAAKDMLRPLPDDEKGWETAPTPGGDQQSGFVTEPGFYRVIGQRQVARIKDDRIREQVARFQDWVYKDVLPAIRKTGGYSLQQVMAFQPVTYTWDEAAAELRQRYGLNFSPQELPRLTRTAGVFKQSGGPRRQYEAMFWFTGTHWAIHPGALGVLAYKLTDVARELRHKGFLQDGFDLSGMSPGPTQLRLGGGES